MTMKESIEKKLGCTIEALLDEWEKSYSSIDTECETYEPISVLTFEELDFLSAYVLDMDKKAS